MSRLLQHLFGQPEAEPTPVQVPKDYPALLRAGREYDDLMSRPGFKRLLDDMEARANKRLAALRECMSHDPLVVQALLISWREAEDSLKFIQVTAQDAIARKVGVIESLAEEASRVGIKAEDIGLDINDGDNSEDDKVASFVYRGAVSQTGQPTTGEDEI